MDELPPIPAFDLEPELSEVGAELDAAWQRVKASRQFILGPEVEAFEREIAAYLGVEHAVGVASGTDALVIALRALGIGAGDEVITSPFSFVATAESIRAVGATPVFVDIDPATFCLRPELLAGALGPRTRAILPVHLFGHGCDMPTIMAFARDHGLSVVEDVAQAFGGSSEARRLGSFGNAGAFSFFPSKNLGGLGDGGLVATNDAELAAKARALRAHGGRAKGSHELVGYNSRLDALQAAFLRVKLPRVDGWNDARREAAVRYCDLLRDVDEIVLPSERAGTRHVYHQFAIRVPDGRRDALRSALAARGIETRIYYPSALHELPSYRAPDAQRPVADAVSQEILSLPFWPRITTEVQQRVANEIRSACGRARRNEALVHT
jgi:dTDP-4-amino-4,6-dideoxygalactose transaminase